MNEHLDPSDENLSSEELFFKKIPAVHFARNEMVKRQFSVTLAQHTATFFQSAQGRNTIIFIYIQHCAKPNSALFVQITI